VCVYPLPSASLPTCPHRTPAQAQQARARAELERLGERLREQERLLREERERQKKVLQASTTTTTSSLPPLSLAFFPPQVHVSALDSSSPVHSTLLRRPAIDVHAVSSGWAWGDTT